MTVCYWCGAKDTLADVGKELDDGKYKMVQCSKCKNAYYVLNKEKMNKPKPMTNEEYIRTANVNDVARCIATKLCELAKHEYGIYDVVDYATVFEWLKEIHK